MNEVIEEVREATSKAAPAYFRRTMKGAVSSLVPTELVALTWAM